MTDRVDDYWFMDIADARKSINQKTVNLIGVVLQTGLLKRTRGTDCSLCVKIVDESNPTSSLPVTVFMATMYELPQVALVGDIIQFNHLEMKARGSEVYASYNKRDSSFALYDGKSDMGFHPYQFSHNFRARELDQKFITRLRKWVADYPEVKGIQRLLSLKEISVGEIDLACKIIHICEIRKDDWILYIWDGTDTPSIPITAKLEDETKNPLPLELEPFPLSRDVLTNFPYVGSILKVKVNQCGERLGVRFLKPGKWVKLHRLECTTRAGLWNIVLLPISNFCYLSDDEDIVLLRKRNDEERLASQWKWMPMQCFPFPTLTETDVPDVGFSTLMHILTYPEVTAKFKCVVRIVSAWPWRVEDFRSPKGICRVRFTLEDPTCRIHAILYAEDGIQLLGDLDLMEDVRKKRNKLLDVAEDENGVEVNAPRNPPWIQCCIKSYYLEKTNPWVTRKYRIFATKFVG